MSARDSRRFSEDIKEFAWGKGIETVDFCSALTNYAVSQKGEKHKGNTMAFDFRFCTFFCGTTVQAIVLLFLDGQLGFLLVKPFGKLRGGRPRQNFKGFLGLA